MQSTRSGPNETNGSITADSVKWLFSSRKPRGDAKSLVELAHDICSELLSLTAAQEEHSTTQIADAVSVPSSGPPSPPALPIQGVKRTWDDLPVSPTLRACTPGTERTPPSIQVFDSMGGGVENEPGFSPSLPHFDMYDFMEESDDEQAAEEKDPLAILLKNAMITRWIEERVPQPSEKFKCYVPEFMEGFLNWVQNTPQGEIHGQDRKRDDVEAEELWSDILCPDEIPVVGSAKWPEQVREKIRKSQLALLQYAGRELGRQRRKVVEIVCSDASSGTGSDDQLQEKFSAAGRASSLKGKEPASVPSEVSHNHGEEDSQDEGSVIITSNGTVITKNGDSSIWDYPGSLASLDGRDA